ncbi:MAG: PAS domain S-box protein [Deltaproteobacteria bacterium]|nr:PAS domain S-box protein [Deltaproteobacteria bacterium]
MNHKNATHDEKAFQQDTQELYEAVKRYKAIADFSPGIICETDLNLKITYMNKFGLEALGLTDDDLNCGVYAIDLAHDNYREKALDRINRIVKGGGVNIAEYPLLKKDGSEFRVLINAVPLVCNDEITGFRFSATDITRIKELQKQVLEARKMEAVAVLAGGVAHLFNNLLTSLILNLEMLEIIGSRNPESLKCIRQMKDVSKSMSEVTKQLTAYAGKGSNNFVVIPVNELMRQTASLVEHKLSPGITFKMNLPEEDYYIEGDLYQLQVVISSIMLNSLEAIEERGYIGITVKKSRVNANNIMKSQTSKTGDYICLEIKDDGKGINKETLDRIFEPFFTTKFQGRGLGLSTAYGIVKHHKGLIEIDSEPGKGTCVKIYMPIHDYQP